MQAKEEDVFKSIFNGTTYKVKKVVKPMVILESEDGKNQILTSIENLRIFYKRGAFLNEK